MGKNPLNAAYLPLTDYPKKESPQSGIAKCRRGRSSQCCIF
ncbi:MAG: hypothetical protein AB7S75_22775 [Desulfococcaceae bacterium]